MSDLLGVTASREGSFCAKQTIKDIANAIRTKAGISDSTPIRGTDLAWNLSKIITHGSCSTNCNIKYGKITPTSNISLEGYTINHGLGETPRAFFIFGDDSYSSSSVYKLTDMFAFKVGSSTTYISSISAILKSTLSSKVNVTHTLTLTSTSATFTGVSPATYLTSSSNNFYWIAVGGNNDTPDEPHTVTYTLSFDTDGGSAVSPVTVNAGTTVQLSGYISSKDGYTFDGWSDTSAREDLISSILMDSNKTVYAKFTEQGGGDPEVIELSGIKLGSTSLQSKAASVKTYIAAVEAGTKYYINWDKGTLGTGAYIAYNSTGGTTAGTAVSGYTMIGASLTNKEYTVPAGATHIYLYNNNGGAQTVFTVTKNPL